MFEKSNYYAKMYLAVLAQKDDPLATKWLVDRGIEQGDLDGPLSLEILRDKMMAVSQ